jgi:hypothetical protein
VGCIYWHYPVTSKFSALEGRGPATMESRPELACPYLERRWRGRPVKGWVPPTQGWFYEAAGEGRPNRPPGGIPGGQAGETLESRTCRSGN